MKQKVFIFAIALMAVGLHQSVMAYDFSAEAPTGQTLYYRIIGSDVAVTYPTTVYNAGMLQGSWNGYTTPVGYLTIPSTVEHGGTTYSVTAVDERAFAQCNGLISVSIPNSIVSIGDQAFLLVNNIMYSGVATGSPWGAKTVNGFLEEGFVFTNSTKNVLTGYYGTNTTITIPNTVTSIGDAAFRSINIITSVSIPNSVTSIGNTAFYGCGNLSSASIPTSVTSIGSSAFAYCTSLATLTIPNSVSSIGYGAFERVANIVYYGSATGSPWGARTVNGYLENGFVYADAERTTLTAYSGTATAIAIPNTVTTIGQRAFIGCSNITSLSIPNSVTNIGNQSFYQCTGLTSITIPQSVVSIGNTAFGYCTGLSTVFFNATNCTSMGSSMYSCAFYGCTNLASVSFGGNVQNIPAYAFYGRSTLSSVIINDGVTNIGICAFAGCTGLATLSVPISVTSIGNGAFLEIRNVSYQGSASGSPWGAYCINAYYEGDFMYSDVSKTVLMGYTGTDTSITVPSTVTSIGENAFRNSNITSISIPSSVIIIGDDAFRQSKLRGVTLPNTLCEIGNRAFMQCSLLTEINIPNTVYSIGNSAFNNCAALEIAYISSSVTSIGSETFSNCTNLRLVSLPQYLQNIGDGAFSNCYKLTDLNVPISVTQIGTDAFGYVRNIIYNGSVEDYNSLLGFWGALCKNGYFYDSVYYSNATMQNLMSVHPLAKNIVVSESTQTVANYAFYHCDVQSITYPSSVTSLGDQLYDGSMGLRNIYCESTTPPSMSIWYDPLAFDYDSVTVHVPCGSLLNYTGNWHCFSHFIEAEAEHTIILTSNNSDAGVATVLLPPTCASNEVVVMAQPYEGYYFNMWNDSVANNPRYLILENDINLVAIFSSTPPAPDTVHVHDTIYVPVHDTTFITLTDTVTNIVYDTITNTFYDTIVVYSTDTLWLHDTLFVHDTLYIHDTVFVTTGGEGVDGVDVINAKIYQRNGQIVVEGSEGETVAVYDAVGRNVGVRQDEYNGVCFDVPATGSYLVKIGNAPARKVVVIR